MKNIYIVLGLLIVGILVASTVFSDAVPTKLSGQDFVTKLVNTPDAILLDVRTPEEFQSGHIKNAININFESATFEKDVTKLDSKKTYFVYCRSGNRSGQAVSVMSANGIKNIFELDGGIASNGDTVQLEVSGASKLTEQEVQGLVLMREEEKLARDVYTTLGNIWNVRIFSNIASSEQTHMDAVKGLLQTYGITDPVGDDTVGAFTSVDMKNLYNTFVQRGSASLEEALQVGANIEDLDIRDLEMLKGKTVHGDIITVYENLQKGSRNHLRAFVRNIQANGNTYAPQYISQAEFEMIISGSQEKGR